ncbi:hypothetical protein RJ640_029695 [Escallonia rubra]|uniref:BHLH domain-containing protein n=1 Tax=Escallonia rubra TaxID=112253 RepID=A0AA88RT31_9ASTE|nr:hypothetical protein RJ640_029695 [Escallonia rubra]
MALETVVFQQDPFSFGSKDFYTMDNHTSNCFEFEEAEWKVEQGFNGCLDSPLSSVIKSVREWDTGSLSPEVCTGDASFAGDYPPPAAPAPTSSRRQRRRTKSFKNKKEMENQRMTHIAVERNRRKQMNHYLAVLRSLMPPSYAERGDQASIVGGAINYVKELEQLLQVLESHKQVKQESINNHSSPLFANFFTFPQYSTCPTRRNNSAAANDVVAEKGLTVVADIEVTVVESHANIKVLSRRGPKQLLNMVAGIHSMCLTILHLNITTADEMVLYSFSVKVEDDCQLTTVNEIATAIHEMVGMIQEEDMSS